MKIPQNVIPYTYQESKRVFENTLSVKEAVENIHKNCGIKINSCADYVYYFRHLITGEGSCRVLNSYTQGYFLEHIKKEYSTEQFKKSLNAFMNLIKKFEGEKVGSKKSMRTIYDKYNQLV